MQASDRLQGLRALARRHRLLRSVRPAPDSGRPGVATGVGEVDQAPQPRPAPAARLAGVLSGLDQLEQHLSQPGHDRSNTGGASLPGGDLPRDSPGRSVRRGEPATVGPTHDPVRRARHPREGDPGCLPSLGAAACRLRLRRLPDRGGPDREQRRARASPGGRRVEHRREHRDRGELGPDGIAALLETAHALVVPSIWEEPAGLVCVEAALARVPIVASRSGGIPELVRDRLDGLLFSRGDAEQCAELLAETLADPGPLEGGSKVPSSARSSGPSNRTSKPRTAFSSERCGHSRPRPDRSGEATSRADRRNAHPHGRSEPVSAIRRADRIGGPAPTMCR